MRYLLFCFIIPFFTTNLVAQNYLSDCGHTIAGDDCDIAFNSSLCELDGFSTSTEGLSIDGESWLTNFCGPGTGIHNNMWIGFVPDAGVTNIQLDFLMDNCINAGQSCSGVQAAIVESADCMSGTVLTCVNCVSSSFTLNTTVTPGQQYFIMIDGCCGDVCDFTIDVTEGLPDPNFTVDAVSFPICELGQETTIFALPNPQGNNYIYQWFGPNGEIVGENESNIEVNQIGDYLVIVREDTNCCFAETSTTISLIADSPQAATTSNTYTINCNTTEVELQGSFSPPVAGHTYQYTWLAPNGTNLCPSTNCYTTTVSETGTYTFFVYDSTTGCIDEVEVDVIDAFANDCTYSLILGDTGGNGWDGASIDVSIAEASTTNYKMTVSDGFTKTIPLSVSEGETIDLTYWNGAFESEHSIELQDAQGTIVNDINGNPIIYNGNIPANTQIRTTAICSSTDLRFVTNESTSTNPSQVCIDLRVDNFNNYEALQYSTHWDDTVLQFSHVDVPAEHAAFDFTSTDFFLFNSSSLILSWSHNSGVNLPDDSLFCTICYDILVCTGMSEITFDGNPIAMLATQAGGAISDFCISPVQLSLSDAVPPVCMAQDITLSSGGVIDPMDIDNGSTDDCNIASMSVNPTSLDCTGMVELTVTDLSGNTSTCTAMVTIQTQAPPICQTNGNISVYLDESGLATITPNDIDNGSSSICSIVSMSLDNTMFDCSHIGFNAVYLTVTDNVGNISTCQSIVEVIDQFGACCPDNLYVNTFPIVDGTYNARVQIQSISQVATGTNVVFEAGTQICLDSGFSVELGAVFEVSIENCPTQEQN